MIPAPKIAQAFDIEDEHIQLPNLIWNKIQLRWMKTSIELAVMLQRLVNARRSLKLFAQHIYDPTDANSVKVYHRLLDECADATRPLRNKANIFCILHEGYSLN